MGVPPLESNRGLRTGRSGSPRPALVEVLSPERRTCRRWILELLPKVMGQHGQGLHTPYGSHRGAPPVPPSRRLVMQRDGWRIHADVLWVVQSMLEGEIADAQDRGMQDAVQ